MTVNESIDTVDVCLTTLGTPVVDTIITVTVTYGSAGEAGEEKKPPSVFVCGSGQNIQTTHTYI